MNSPPRPRSLDGISYAALLFLVALGFTLIFGVMRILNVAHGSLYAFGGYMAATLACQVAPIVSVAACRRCCSPQSWSVLCSAAIIEIGLLRRS